MVGRWWCARSEAQVRISTMFPTNPNSFSCRYFLDQPLSQTTSDDLLVLYYFEDYLKKFFNSILQILEALSLDPLSYIRLQSLRHIFTLLKDSPEQEQNLLRLLVNKLVRLSLRQLFISFIYLVYLLRRATQTNQYLPELPTTSSNSSKPTLP